MIVHLRIDDRLIHGQVATMWSRALDINAIVVANDATAADEMQKKMQLMSGQSTGKKCSVQSVAGAIKLLSDPRADNMKVFMLVKGPEDAIEICKHFKVPEINVGNYMLSMEGKWAELTSYIRVNMSQLEKFEELSKMVPSFYHQIIPERPRIELIPALAKARAELESK